MSKVTCWDRGNMIPHSGIVYMSPESLGSLQKPQNKGYTSLCHCRGQKSCQLSHAVMSHLSPRHVKWRSRKSKSHKKFSLLSRWVLGSKVDFRVAWKKKSPAIDYLEKKRDAESVQNIVLRGGVLEAKCRKVVKNVTFASTPNLFFVLFYSNFCRDFFPHYQISGFMKTVSAQCYSPKNFIAF